MNVICFEDEAYFSLVETVVKRIKSENKISENKWIGTDEAMALLHITSKTTLQKYRDEDRIRFSQLDKKVILYDRDSILELINKSAKDRF
ncbi:MAG: helix-turn-helix domain-containing protein [Bacteroidota bacterium]